MVPAFVHGTEPAVMIGREVEPGALIILPPAAVHHAVGVEVIAVNLRLAAIGIGDIRPAAHDFLSGAEIKVPAVLCDIEVDPVAFHAVLIDAIACAGRRCTAAQATAAAASAATTAAATATAAAAARRRNRGRRRSRYRSRCGCGCRRHTRIVNCLIQRDLRRKHGRNRGGRCRRIRHCRRIVQGRLQGCRECRVGDIRECRRARRATRIERRARRRPGRIHLVVSVDCQIRVDRIRRRIKGRIAARRLRETHEAVLAVVEVLCEVERQRRIGCIRRGCRSLPE